MTRSTTTTNARPSRTPTPKPSRTVTATPTAAVAAELAEVYARINRLRQEANLSELTPAAALEQAAQAHAVDMAGRGVLSHAGGDGSDVAQRMRRAGYEDASAWGEIIASVTGGPTQAVSAWWNSDPHRAIMLDPNLREFGAGRAQLRRDAMTYYVVVFGRR